MKKLMASMLAVSFVATAAFAQTAPSPTPPPAQATPAAPPAAGPQTGKDVRAQCKADAVTRACAARRAKVSCRTVS